MPNPPKPFSPASARNQGPILAVLREHLQDRHRVLEIGSGTGQHAVHFAAAMPHLQWQCSDLAENLSGIGQWLAEAALPNTPAPMAFDVAAAAPAGRFGAVYTANTLHIMGWPSVQRLFARLPDLLEPAGLLVVYGPFNIGGRFTGPGNAAFDAALRAADPVRGLRDLEAVERLAQDAGLARLEVREMPADNRCVVWRRQDGPTR